MKHHGRVRGVDSAGAALIELDSLSQCVRCRRGEGCGAVWFDPNRPGITLRIEKPERQLSAQSERLPAVAAGQSVLVEIDDSGTAWLWPVLGAYGLPLICMLLATGITSALAGILTDTLAGTLGGGESREAAGVLPEIGILLSAVSGLYGGILAWRKLSSGCLSGILADAERSLCLQSARIVAINQPSA